MSETYIISTTDGKSSAFHTPRVEEFLYSLDKARKDKNEPLPHAYMDDPEGTEWAVHFVPENVSAVSVPVRPLDGERRSAAPSTSA